MLEFVMAVSLVAVVIFMSMWIGFINAEEERDERLYGRCVTC